MVASGNVGLAFALVLGAGLATTLGASFAFCSKLADYRILAGSLGVSAGVMLYVSFVEIFVTKGIAAFEDAGVGEDRAYQYATGCFFAGILAIMLVDRCVHTLLHFSEASRAEKKRAALEDTPPSRSLSDVDSAQVTIPPSMAAPDRLHTGPADKLAASDLEGGSSVAAGDGPRDRPHALEGARPVDIAHGTVPDNPAVETTVRRVLEADETHALKRMGLLTAVAIFIHNLPEGLATFVAALADPTAGVAIAIAIALHNIPEGVCVAMPVYYATGSRWKGFLWAFLSGVSEPVGGLLGFLVLYGNNASDLMYGILFGGVAGMMVYISFKELLPTALKYDPADRYVTMGVLAGMAIMAASLLMFTV